MLLNLINVAVLQAIGRERAQGDLDPDPKLSHVPKSLVGCRPQRVVLNFGR